MPSLDLMTERELIAHLHQLAAECDGLDHRIAFAAQLVTMFATLEPVFAPRAMSVLTES
jgi:hypothetical protein